MRLQVHPVPVVGVPIPYEVCADERIVIAALVGTLTVDDYAEAARQAIADPRLRPGFGLLIDGRALNPLPSIEELRALVQVARELQLHGVEPFALVAATDLQFLVGRLFATMAAASIGLKSRVFRSIEVAREWLRASVAWVGPADRVAARRSREGPIDPEELGGAGGVPTTSA